MRDILFTILLSIAILLSSIFISKTANLFYANQKEKYEIKNSLQSQGTTNKDPQK